MIYLMNSAIIPQNFIGMVSVKGISIAKLLAIVEGREWISAIGHEGTIQMINSLLGKNLVQFNRITVEANSGDSAIVIQAKSRLPEGKVLSREEFEKIGYVIKEIRFLSDNCNPIDDFNEISCASCPSWSTCKDEIDYNITDSIH